MNRPLNPRAEPHPPWLTPRELLATETALGSVNRVLASLDRIEAHDAQIAATLADYRTLTTPAALGRERN